MAVIRGRSLSFVVMGSHSWLFVDIRGHSPFFVVILAEFERYCGCSWVVSWQYFGGTLAVFWRSVLWQYRDGILIGF